MKHLYLVTILLCCSCAFNDQQKAERLVKDYLKENLNDPDSYESVSFDKIMPEYESYTFSNPIGMKLQRQSVIFDSISISYGQKAQEAFIPKSESLKFEKLETLFRKKSDSVNNVIKEKESKWNAPVVGYTIEHTYRAKNGFGALTLESRSFNLDSALTHAF